MLIFFPHLLSRSIIVVLSFSLLACGEDAFVDNDGPDDPEMAPKISRNGATISHTDNRRGSNCMTCHYEDNNRYVYTIAGTVYQTADSTLIYPNATIKFYSEPDGNGIYYGSVAGDANGNFYTTEPLPFSTAAYPVVEGTNGEIPKSMGNFVMGGACNSCHGANVAHIYVIG